MEQYLPHRIGLTSSRPLDIRAGPSGCGFAKRRVRSMAGYLGWLVSLLMARCKIVPALIPERLGLSVPVDAHNVNHVFPEQRASDDLVATPTVPVIHSRSIMDFLCKK